MFKNSTNDAHVKKRPYEFMSINRISFLDGNFWKGGGGEGSNRLRLSLALFSKGYYGSD